MEVKRALVWGALCGALFCGNLHAQIDPTELRDKNSRRLFLPSVTEPPILSPDLGTIEPVTRRPRPPWITLSTEQRYLYVDNAFFTKTDPVGSTAWNGWFELEISPYSTYLWRPRLTVEHEMYRFERASDADLDSQTVRLESSLALTPDRSFQWTLAYAYWRVASPHDDAGEVLRVGEFTSRLLYRSQLAGQPDLWWTAFWDFEFRNSHPSRDDRLSHELHLSVIWFPSSTVSMAIFAEPEWRFYPKDPSSFGATQDFHFAGGIRVEWAPYEFLSLSTEARWTMNDSSGDTRDYQLWEPSLSLYASLHF